MEKLLERQAAGVSARSLEGKRGVWFPMNKNKKAPKTLKRFGASF
ncbi:hypothetical protein [Pseudomonas cremoris]|nr:hypothetical protein [Pseudomonas cremoris]